MSQTVASQTSGDRFRHTRGVLSTRQCDTTVLLDVNGGLYYTLNEVGGRIWEMIGEDASVSEISQRLAEEFDASIDVLAADTTAMVGRLLEAMLVEGAQ
jgi:hypothetical protein